MQRIRLQKYLAECGVCSRRRAEELIAEGRVTVNGIVAAIGVSVVFEDDVRLGGKSVKPERRRVWVMLNKPDGYITSAKDQFGRKTVLDLLEGVSERIFPVGRLDYDTKGLLLLTNDGDLANKLLHPKYNVEKKYVASLSRKLDEEALTNLQNGVIVDGRVTKPTRIAVMINDDRDVEITITEGRNRIVRRLFAAVGNKVVKLERVGLAGLVLNGLEEGKYRFLTKNEVDELRKLSL